MPYSSRETTSLLIYSTDVCGLIFPEITASRRAWRVILEAIFRTLFLTPALAFVSFALTFAFENFNFRPVSMRRDGEKRCDPPYRDAIFCLAFTARRLRSWKFAPFSLETQATLDRTFYTFSIRRPVFSSRDRYCAGRFPGFISPLDEIQPICIRRMRATDG